MTGPVIIRDDGAEPCQLSPLSTPGAKALLFCSELATSSSLLIVHAPFKRLALLSIHSLLLDTLQSCTPEVVSMDNQRQLRLKLEAMMKITQKVRDSYINMFYRN